jgi:hypothetical protein
MATLVTIWWRDIPMQVIAREGRRTEKRVLDKRFQFAVDKAAINAGRKSYDDYIAEMGRDEKPTDEADLAKAVEQEAARLDREYSKDVLHALIAAGGEGARR